MIYNLATAWIIIGTLVYVWHNVYVWDCTSEKFKVEIISFKFFVATIFIFPVVACILMRIIIEVEIEFRRWKKERGLN